MAARATAPLKKEPEYDSLRQAELATSLKREAGVLIRKMRSLFCLPLEGDVDRSRQEEFLWHLSAAADRGSIKIQRKKPPHQEGL